MSLVLVTPPALEPLTLAEVAAHLRLGRSSFEPAPDAPSVALAIAGGGLLTNGAYRYRVTFVTADGETEGGAISAPIAVTDATSNGRIALTAIPIGGSVVTARRLYRTAANGAEYFLVATIANNTATSHTDNVADVALGAGVPVNNSTGDPLLLSFIKAAREHVENYTNRALVSQRWRLTLDAFPCSDVIGLQMPLVQSVESFTYVDANGDSVAFADYSLDSDHFPGRVVRDVGVAWPSTLARRNALSIDFVAGFGAPADVPSTIKAAMCLLIGGWWETRESVNVGNLVNEMPFGVAALLASYRRPAMEMA